MGDDLKGAIEDMSKKFNVSSKEVKSLLKEIVEKNEHKTKFGYIEPLLDNVLSQVKDITKSQFAKMAKEAWERKYPDGRNKRSNAYVEFLRVELPKLKEQYPGLTYAERMKQASILWKYEKEKLGNATTQDTTMTTKDTTSISLNPKRKPETKDVSAIQHDSKRVLRKRAE